MSYSDSPDVLLEWERMSGETKEWQHKNLGCSDTEKVKQLRNYIKEGHAKKSKAEGLAAGEVIKSKFNIDMTDIKISCLRSRTWLNDEVINFYFSMLQERNLAEHKGRKSLFFSSFFMDRLLSGSKSKFNYGNVQRWTAKIDIFQLDKIFVPINVENYHWMMAVVFVQQKLVLLIDSLKSPANGMVYLDFILNWIRKEAKGYSTPNCVKEPCLSFQNEKWITWDNSEHFPKQSNGVDCGVFALLSADVISQNLPLRGAFAQEDMNDLRLKIGIDILHGSLLKDPGVDSEASDHSLQKSDLLSFNAQDLTDSSEAGETDCCEEEYRQLNEALTLSKAEYFEQFSRQEEESQTAGQRSEDCMMAISDDDV